MKWPLSLTIIRHGQSAYNILRDKKNADQDYKEFVKLFDKRSPDRRAARENLAVLLRERFSTGTSDYLTPLTNEGQIQAIRTGRVILDHAPKPDAVFVSPYLRTRDTFDYLWQKGARIPVDGVTPIFDDRIREQEHGLALLYNDWRIFQTFHPEQWELYRLLGPYWYQYPQGESVSMVRDRIRSFMTMLVREYAGKHVWVVSHHLTLLSIRANLERLSPEEFMRIDNEDKPINCGVTVYEGRPDLGSDGKLVLKEYNKKLY